MIGILISVFVISLLGSFLSSKLMIPILYKLNILDDPKTRPHPAHIYKNAIPRSGGMALFIGIWLGTFLFIPKTPGVLGLFLASFLAMVIGLFDDRFDLSPVFRLGMNILAVIIVLGFGIHIPFITYPLQGMLGEGFPLWHMIPYPHDGILHLDYPLASLTLFHISVSITLAQIVTLVWIIWLMNMLNWSKGVDQMPGTVAIAAIVIGILSLRFPYSETQTQIAALLSFSIAGAALGFLPFNFPPSKMLPGYSATATYLLLACVSFIASVKLATAILVLAIPFTDGVITIIRRIASGNSPLKGDRKHAYHMLLDLGIPKRGIIFFYWAVSILLGIGSLFLSTTGKLFAICMVIAIIGGGICYLLIITKRKND